MMENTQVLLGMSGGVDSAAAAVLLLQQGYEVIGAVLRLQEDRIALQGFERDLADARQVAAQLGIELLVLDHRNAFRRHVLDYFVDEYDRGRTPNPCVECNRYIKIPLLCEEADRLGIFHVATGHYARIGRAGTGGRWHVAQARNIRKDQSYALYTLPQEQLGRTLLPLGRYTKEEAREIVAAAGLHISHKSESQDICFVPDGDYGAFLRNYTGREGVPGNFIAPDGRMLGPHRGIWHYTVGQRKGLGISFGEPVFVCGIDPESGDIHLSDNNSLFQRELQLQQVCWTGVEKPEGSAEFRVKIRYNHTPQLALVTPAADGSALAVFREPQRAITPGQSAVFYREEMVAGGGIIEDQSKFM